jgi:hypothetical protein
MNAGKPNLLEIEIACLIPFVLLRGRRRPADASKILAVFIDRYRVFRIADIYVERGVIETVLEFGKVNCLEPAEPILNTL